MHTSRHGLSPRHGISPSLILAAACAFLLSTDVLPSVEAFGQEQAMAQREGRRLFRRRASRTAESGKPGDVQLTEIRTPRGKANPALGPGDYSRTITVGDRERVYHLHVPPSYDRTKPLPLVMNFHGGGGNPMQQRRDTQMDAVADKNNFIVAYGQGTSAFGKFLTWNVYLSDTYATKKNVDDIGYVKAMLDDLEDLFKIDAKRVYATGYSMGGIISYALACEMSDRIAAIAPVAATMQNPPETRKAKRPVPVMHFHGMKDDHCLFEGGVGENAKDKMDRPAASEGIDWWVKHNGAGDKPTKTGKVGEAEFIQYGEDNAPGTVVLWKVWNGGHTWPGGTSTLPEDRVGPVSQDIKASELMWEFFSRHSL
jgi:polyhydroxybutyrate depolymerase